MPKLPLVSGDECIAVLEQLGYRVTRIRGSHARLVCQGRVPITVPKHHTRARSAEKFVELF